LGGWEDEEKGGCLEKSRMMTAKNEKRWMIERREEEEGAFGEE
jgi:hypothetical protein